MPPAAHRPMLNLIFFLPLHSTHHIHKSASQLKKLRSKLELLAVRDIIMARGNQRDKAREKNQKELSAQVKLPLCSPGPPSPPNNISTQSVAQAFNYL